MDPAASTAGGDEASKITRVRFTKEQLAVLEDFFTSTSESPSVSQLEELSKKIDTTVARVKNWFGTRRAKKRKSTGGDDDEPEEEGQDKTPAKPAATPTSATSATPTTSVTAVTPSTPSTPASTLKRKAPESPLAAAGSATKALKTEKGKAKAKGKGKAPEEEEEDEGDLSDMELIAAPLGVDWSKVTDVPRLQGEVQRLNGRLKESEDELKKAKARIKELEKGGAVPASTSAAAALPATTSAKKASDAEPTAAELKQADQVASKFKKSIPTQLLNQMVYRPGLVRGSSRLSAEVPNVSLLIFKSLVGDTIFNREFAGKKQLTQYKISLSETTYGQIFSKDLSKSLRYGAHLSPNWPINLTYSKATETITVKGTFTMVK